MKYSILLHIVSVHAPNVTASLLFPVKPFLLHNFHRNNNVPEPTGYSLLTQAQRIFTGKRAFRGNTKTDRIKRGSYYCSNFWSDRSEDFPRIRNVWAKRIRRNRQKKEKKDFVDRKNKKVDPNDKKCNHTDTKTHPAGWMVKSIVARWQYAGVCLHPKG